jgi:hypothetical protein
MLLSGKLSVIATGLVFLPAVIGAQCAATLNTAVVRLPALEPSSWFLTEYSLWRLAFKVITITLRMANIMEALYGPMLY